jgi:polyprenyl P-hydroxybenzoate/phenylacrylic acid decarboxylase-like protein
MSRRRGKGEDAAPGIAPVYEGPEVLSALLERAGSKNRAEDVVAMFTQAQAAGEPRSAVIPGIFQDEPRFESPEAARRLYSNLFGLWARLAAGLGAHDGQLRVFGREDWNAPVASGSNPSDAMVVCPCSMGTLAAIAHGLSDNLIERAADVVLKEQKKLILVPRETPFSTLHLENMLALSRMNAVILPANPGFYHHPQSVDDLVDFVVARILDQLGIAHELTARWGEER